MRVQTLFARKKTARNRFTMFDQLVSKEIVVFIRSELKWRLLEVQAYVRQKEDIKIHKECIASYPDQTDIEGYWLCGCLTQQSIGSSGEQYWLHLPGEMFLVRGDGRFRIVSVQAGKQVQLQVCGETGAHNRPKFSSMDHRRFHISDGRPTEKFIPIMHRIHSVDKDGLLTIHPPSLKRSFDFWFQWAYTCMPTDRKVAECRRLKRQREAGPAPRLILTGERTDEKGKKQWCVRDLDKKRTCWKARRRISQFDSLHRQYWKVTEAFGNAIQLHGLCNAIEKRVDEDSIAATVDAMNELAQLWAIPKSICDDFAQVDELQAYAAECEFVHARCMELYDLLRYLLDYAVGIRGQLQLTAWGTIGKVIANAYVCIGRILQQIGHPRVLDDHAFLKHIAEHYTEPEKRIAEIMTTACDEKETASAQATD